MNTTPESIAVYLDSLDKPYELTGYLCLNDDEIIIANAGMVGDFNLDEIDKTQSVVASVPFLEGLLPENVDSTTVIRNVHIENNHYFDIHLLYNDTGCCILFVDSTRSGKKLQQEQQLRLDLDFRNDKRKTGS